jgi:hypothetical protein
VVGVVEVEEEDPNSDEWFDETEVAHSGLVTALSLSQPRSSSRAMSSDNFPMSPESSIRRSASEENDEHGSANRLNGTAKRIERRNESTFIMQAESVPKNSIKVLSPECGRAS